jgi:hypothetical protein
MHALSLWLGKIRDLIQNSVSDPHSLDANPDPAILVIADSYQDPSLEINVEPNPVLPVFFSKIK